MNIEEQIRNLQTKSAQPIGKSTNKENMQDDRDLTSMKTPSTKETDFGVPGFGVPVNVVTRKRSGRPHSKAEKNGNRNCGTVKIKSINETLENINQEGMRVESPDKEESNKRRRGRPAKAKITENTVDEEVVKESYTLRKSARKQNKPTKVRRITNNKTSVEGLGEENIEFSAVTNKRLRSSPTDDAKSNKMANETPASLKLPFVKSSPCWQVMESSKVFLSLPQQPHFLPLKKYVESEREGLAIGLMVNFSTVVNNMLKFDISDPDESIEEMTESLINFERHGFNLYNLLDMLKCFQTLKKDHKRVMHEIHATNELKSDARNEEGLSYEKLEEIRKSIMELEQKEKTLNDKWSSTLKQAEGFEREIIRLQIERKGIEKEFLTAKSSLDCARGVME